MGAMAPEWNADARAVWYGLTPAHTRAHLLRALLEGSAYALRDILGAMRADRARAARDRLRRGRRPLAAVAPDPGRRDRPAGGRRGRRRDDRPRRRDAGGGRGRRRIRRWRPRQRRCRAQGGAPLQPDPATAAVYEAAYTRYRAVYDALRPVFTV